MRRVLLFAAFLLLLGLTTATAASFDVQPEEITAFSDSATVTTPVVPQAPRRLFLVGDAPHGSLTTSAPTTTKGNEKTTFVRGDSAVATEQRPPAGNNSSYWVSWRSTTTWPDGLTFGGKKVRVYFERTAGSASLLRAGLFSCPTSAADATVVGSGQCRLLAEGSSTGSEVDLTSVADVTRGHELRLKLVNGSSQNPPPSIQWGYREQNRSARIVVDPDSCTVPADC